MVWKRRRNSAVAQQIFVLQTLMVAAVVVMAIVLAYVGARYGQLGSARERSVAVAQAVANSPTVLRALRTSDPSRTVQPYAERVRVDTGADFVVVMALDRTRYSHPNPAMLGKSFIGDLGGAPRGEVFTQEYTGTLGPSMRAVVPLYDGDRVIALVSSGITLDRIDARLRAQLPAIGAGAVTVLVAGFAGAWLIRRRLRRQTHGLGEREITRMYEYYDAVLHAVREGLLLIDRDSNVQLVNDEGTRLLGLDHDVAGTPIAELGLPATLTEAVMSSSSTVDELHVVDDYVLLVNQAPAYWEGQHVGWVVTVRDHTELQAVAGELDAVRGMAESLRAQNHEAANRLHAIVSLIEMGRGDEAITFATEELELAQALTDRVVTAVDDPVLAALLLGKSSQATERGIDFDIHDDSSVDALCVEPRDLVTMLGNLVDNAIDAAAGSETPRVAVRVVGDDDHLVLTVEDSGPGLTQDDVQRIFQRGWSTKTASGPGGRGLGLALVGQVARKYRGTVDVGSSDLGGALFTVRIPEEAA